MVSLSGMPVVLHDSVVEVERSWRERLLSWPWHPWRKTKFVRNPVFTGRNVFMAFDKVHMTREQFYELPFEERSTLLSKARNPLLAGEKTFKWGGDER